MPRIVPCSVTKNATPPGNNFLDPDDGKGQVLLSIFQRATISSYIESSLVLLSVILDSVKLQTDSVKRSVMVT
jgi:hypothetical protein